MSGQVRVNSYNSPTAALFSGGKIIEVESHTKAWGWPAVLKRSPDAEYAHRFLLHLGDGSSADIPPLPVGMTVVDVIAAYLTELKDFILANISYQFGDDVQWCITVPNSLWSESTKTALNTAAERSGMVQGPNGLPGIGSPYKLLLVKADKAAVVCCLHHLTSDKIDWFVVYDYFKCAFNS